MRQTTVTLIDDIDGSAADETVTFALDGVSFEIDLSAKNAAALREALVPWMDKARTTGKPRKALPTVKALGDPRSAVLRA